MTRYMNARKKSWLETCIEIHNFHVEQFRLDKFWTIANTADNLGRSFGNVAQAIKVGKWLKTHENKIRSFRSLSAALEWIRETEKTRRSEFV